MTSKKIIAFSLWGNNPKYTIGAIKNAQLALEIYPDWTCRFYTGSSVPLDIIEKLKMYTNTEVIEMGTEGSWVSMFWRFFPASEEDVDIMISRDADSRLSLREKAAVDEWIFSEKGFHIMRDHPWHGVPILGGMWGAKKGVIKDIKQMIENFTQEDVLGVDQTFLRGHIYPLIVENSIAHDEFFSGKSFPVKREGYEFVGDVFDCEDKRDDTFWKILLQWMSQQ